MPPKRKLSVATEKLSKVLSLVEIAAIKNQQIVSKIECALPEEDDAQKIKFQKLQYELDKTKHLLEKAHESSNVANQSTAEANDQDKRANTALLTELNTLRSQIEDCNRSIQNKEGDLTKCKVERDRVLADKTRLEQVLKQKDEELTSMTSQYEAASSKGNQTMKEKSNLKMKFETLTVDRNHDTFTIERLRTFTKTLESDNLYLNEQLESEKAKYATAKRLIDDERKSRAVEVEAAQQDNEINEKRINGLEGDIEEKMNQLLQLRSETEEACKEYADTEHKYKTEIMTQGRLIDLLKTQVDAHKTKSTDLSEGMSTMRNEMQSMLEENIQLKESVQRCEDLEKEFESRKTKMEQELKVANDLLAQVKRTGPQLSKEELEDFSPTAAAAVKLLRSGMTLTEMYSEYITKSQTAERLAAENDALVAQQTAILTELREKEPAIEHMRNEYEKSQGFIQGMSNQLDESNQLVARLRLELYHANDSRTRLATENDAFVIQIKDNNQKIAGLMNKLDKSDAMGVDGDEKYSAILELQNELADKNKEIRVLEMRLDNLTASNAEDLEAKLKEMSHLLELEKIERSNIEMELLGIKKQRDTWNDYFERRRLEDEENEFEETEMVPNAPTRKSPRKSLSGIKEKEQLIAVEAHFKEYKDRMEHDFSELKARMTSLEKQNNDYLCRNQKYEVVIKNQDFSLMTKDDELKRNRGKIESLTEQHQRMSRTLDTESKNTTKITDALLASSEDKTHMQISLAASKSKNELLECEISQLREELQSIERNAAGQTVILDTIQQLSQQMNENKTSGDLYLQADLRSAKADVEAYRAKIETIHYEHAEAVTKWKSQEQDLAKKLEEEKQKASTISQELSRVKNRQLLQFSKRGGEEGPPLKASVANDQELKQYDTELRLLKEDIERKETQIADYKKIAAESERRMNENIEEFTKLKLMKQREVEELKATIAERDSSIVSQNEEIDRLKKESGTEDIQRLHVQIDNLNTQIGNLEENLSTKNDELAALHDNYLKQVIEHGKAQEVAQKWRLEKQEVERSNQQLLHENEVQKVRNDSSVSEWGQERDNLKQQITEFSERLNKQNQKNKLLHEQLEQLNNEVTNSRRRGSITNLDSSQIQVNDDDSLRELTKIMRRDQEIAESERDVAKAEVIRFKQRVRNQDVQIDTMKKSLSELETMIKKPSRTAEQHKELIESVNQLNILRESNHVLRDEKSRLKSEVDECDKNIKELENQLRPLIRLEAETKQLVARKDAELVAAKVHLDAELNKLKTAHQDDLKKATMGKISIEKVKQIREQSEQWKKQHDLKSAELRAKETELLEAKNQLQQQKTTNAKLDEEKKTVESLTAENTKLKGELTTLTTKLKETDDKMKRIRTMAVKYRDENKKLKEDAAKIGAAKPPAVHALVQTEGDESVLGGMQSDTKAEMDMMKKMFQRQIKNLQENLEKNQTSLTDTKASLDEIQKSKNLVEVELSKSKDEKSRLLKNAKSKIMSLKKDLEDAKKAKEASPEATTSRPLPDTKVAAHVSETKSIAEVTPQQREPKQPQGRVIGKVVPSHQVPKTTAQAIITPMQSTVVNAEAESTTPSVSSAPSVPVVSSSSVTMIATADSIQTEITPLVHPDAPVVITVPATSTTPTPSEIPTMSGISSPPRASQKRTRANTNESEDGDKKRFRITEDLEAASSSKQDPAPPIDDPLDEPEPITGDDDEQDLNDNENLDDEQTEDQPVQDTEDVQMIDDADLDHEPVEILDDDNVEHDIVEISDEPSTVPVIDLAPPPFRIIPPPLEGILVMGRQRPLPTRIPTTPGIIHVSHEDDDGCVPHTPTLVGTRSQHEGNQALVSPAPVMAQSQGQRFHFFGDASENDHSVPGTSDGVSSTTEPNVPDN